MPQLKPGDQAPSFDLVDQQGQAVKLADFKGKKVLLCFLSQGLNLWMHQAGLQCSGCPDRTGGFGGGGPGNQSRPG